MTRKTNIRAVRQELDSGRTLIDEAKHRAERARRDFAAVVNAFLRSEQNREKRILIVEDDDEFARAYVSILEKTLNGFSTAIANTADHAMTLLSEDPFDLVILDLHLSEEVTGIDLVRFIRTRTQRPLIPILMISGQTDALSTIAELSGATAYLPKPVDVGAFVSDVERLLRIASDD